MFLKIKFNNPTGDSNHQLVKMDLQILKFVKFNNYLLYKERKVSAYLLINIKFNKTTRDSRYQI